MLPPPFALLVLLPAAIHSRRAQREEDEKEQETVSQHVSWPVEPSARRNSQASPFPTSFFRRDKQAERKESSNCAFLEGRTLAAWHAQSRQISPRPQKSVPVRTHLAPAVVVRRHPGTSTVHPHSVELGLGPAVDRRGAGAACTSMHSTSRLLLARLRTQEPGPSPFCCLSTSSRPER